jgi:hypothetical protein
MKNSKKIKIIIVVTIFLIAKTIISDWDHFKEGLFGESFVSKIEK